MLCLIKKTNEYLVLHKVHATHVNPMSNIKKCKNIQSIYD